MMSRREGCCYRAGPLRHFQSNPGRLDRGRLQKIATDPAARFIYRSAL
jgi:hypothetical protein